MSATLVFASCNKPGNVPSKPVQQEEIIQAEQPDTIIVDNNETFFTEEQILAPVANTTSSGNKYFLISASFSDYANAEKHQKKLISQGLSSEILTREDGVNSQFYKVSYMSFNNYNEAEQKLKQEKNTTGKGDIWLLVKE